LTFVNLKGVGLGRLHLFGKGLYELRLGEGGEKDIPVNRAVDDREIDAVGHHHSLFEDLPTANNKYFFVKFLGDIKGFGQAGGHSAPLNNKIRLVADDDIGAAR
jgi:hypothetical protein